ncbi:hypothetical protein EDD18DRAFT_1407493 [Armillaria luteobubalina]|uniref:Tc1-like transposase DDE domain-containing protein n=1 Tax=Armillaria luteobubalina TaxID=153913 RepID=A0AA39UUA8_9AGAR|nr:hypothetical protein EDD18DRAFT_1407493 [Armillaria luteobubalina]
MRYEFLLPYSPDYNLIELGFSAIKAHVRCHGNIVRAAMSEDDDTDVYILLNEAVWSIDVDDAQGWYSQCSYSVN